MPANSRWDLIRGFKGLKSVRGYRYVLYCVIPVTNQLKNTFSFETCILTVRFLQLSTHSVFCLKHVDVIHQLSTVAVVFWSRIVGRNV